MCVLCRGWGETLRVILYMNLKRLSRESKLVLNLVYEHQSVEWCC